MVYKQRADIHKAFKVLEEAIDNKEAEIKEQLRGPEFPDYINNLVSNSFKVVGNSVGKFEDILNNGITVVERFSGKAQNELDRNPWGFVGKVALGGIALGLIIGSRYRNSRSRAER